MILSLISPMARTMAASNNTNSNCYNVSSGSKPITGVQITMGPRAQGPKNGGGALDFLADGQHWPLKIWSITTQPKIISY